MKGASDVLRMCFGDGFASGSEAVIVQCVQRVRFSEVEVFDLMDARTLQGPQRVLATDR